jgi:uncharacterized protein (PEP-CTERM system associated)
MRPVKCITQLLPACTQRYRVWLQVMLICLCAPSAAPGAEWKFGTSISASGTLTDNVNLAPPGQQQSDFILGITPSIRADLDAARLKVHASLAPTLYTYVQNSQNDYLAGNLNAFASLEAAEKFFYIDASALVGESYLNPFRSQPENGGSITSNRIQTTTLGLSPYIKSTTSSGVSYLLRDDNTYSTSNYSGLANIYINNLTATIDGPTGRPLRLGADYNYNYTQFQNQPQAFQLQLARLRATHTFDPELSATVDGGYETNDYGVTRYQGAIYGAGFDWKPSPITDLHANAEHRFFGPSYTLGFNNRTRLTALNLYGSRGIQTYPQQLFIPAGNTQAVLDAIFRASIPDPIERQKAVDNFLQQTGLPSSLATPFTYYTNRIYVVEAWGGSFALIGARNALTFSLGWFKNTAITAGGQALPNALNLANDFEGTTAGVAFNHQLSALTSVTASASHNVTYNNNTNVAQLSSISSTQNTFLVTLSQQFSPKTSGTLGARYVRFHSNVASDYNEAALIAGVLHTF